MLRVTDDVRRLSALKWLAVLGVAAAMSALRGPAEPPAAPEPTPWLLEYLPEQMDAFVALRPALLLSRPEMKPLADAWNARLAKELRQAGFGPGFTLRLEDIDQILGPFEFKTYSADEMKQHADPNGPRHAALLGATVIRTTRDVDWPALLRALPKSESVKELIPGEFEVRAAGHSVIRLRVLDARTLTLRDESTPPAGGKASRERWGPACQAIERAGFAYVLNNRGGKLTATLSDSGPYPAPVPAALVAPFAQVNILAFGLHWDERPRATVAIETADPPAAATLFAALGAVRTLLVGLAGDPKTRDDWTKMGVELLDSATARRDGNVIAAEGKAAPRWADLLGKVPLTELFGEDKDEPRAKP